MVPNNSCVIPLNYLTVGYVIKSLLSNHFRCIIDIFLDMIALKILYKIYRLVNCRLFSDFTILCFEYVIIPPMGWNLFKNSIFYHIVKSRSMSCLVTCLGLQHPKILDFLNSNMSWLLTCQCTLLCITQKVMGVQKWLQNGIRKGIHNGIHKGIHNGIHNGIQSRIWKGIWKGIKKETFWYDIVEGKLVTRTFYYLKNQIFKY